MSALRRFLYDVENMEPRLFYTLGGELALSELEELEGDGLPAEGVTLVSIRGEPQKIDDTMVIGSRNIEGTRRWMLEVPVILVRAPEKEWTTPPKEPITEPEAR